MQAPIHETVHFNKEDRVRLWFKVKDLLDDNDRHAQLSATGMDFLEDLLQRKLGKLLLAGGYDASRRIQAFITTASQNELLEVIESAPIARLAAHKDYFEKLRYAGVAQDRSQRVMDEAYSELNVYLTTTSSPARFDKKGKLHRDPFAPEVPVALGTLPGQEGLRSDLEMRCAEDSPTVLVFVDLDNFKQVNDSLGHPAGDECLSKVAEVLGTIAAMRGKVYRYGGDEFAIVLPNCTSPEAAATAERIRQEIERANRGGPVKVTASIGVVGTDLVGRASESLITKADQAMYVSKQTGRNKVTVFEN